MSLVVPKASSELRAYQSHAPWRAGVLPLWKNLRSGKKNNEMLGIAWNRARFQKMRDFFEMLLRARPLSEFTHDQDPEPTFQVYRSLFRNP